MTIVSFQKKKKPKQKLVASTHSEEAVAKEIVAIVQEPPRPAVRKRRERTLKAGMETVTRVRSQKVRTVSPPCVIQGIVSWHQRSIFSIVFY